MYFNEEQLKELRKKVDDKGKWFKDASFRDIEVKLSTDELIDKAYDLVQLSFEYRTIQPDAKQEDIVRVSRLRDKLNIDFFLETQRILSNSKKRTNAYAELLGEFTKYNYHFTYSGFDSFYYVDSEKKSSTTFIINAFSTLSDWHSPFFQHFVVEENAKKGQVAQHTVRSNEANYQLLLAVYLHKWLRWQMSLIGEPNTYSIEENDKNIKPKEITPIPKNLEDIFIDPKDIQKLFEILYDEGFTDTNGLPIKKGIRSKISAIYHLMKQKNYLKADYLMYNREVLAGLFKDKFKLNSFSGVQLMNSGKPNSEHFKDYNRLIPKKK